MAGTDLPDVRSDADVPAEAPAYDVVVVGFGIAGGCAALEAARAGARVLLLERAAVHGGTSSLSGGHFYLGGGTAVQVATGHEDPVEEMVKYLTATSKEPEPDKIRAYCEGSVEHFDWLETLGFQFERSYYPEKAVIQPGTQGLMFTGNEKVWPYLDEARPAPRGHKVPVPGDTEGTKMVMDLLRERVEEAGVEVRYETGASHLVTSPRPVRWSGSAWKSFDTTGVVRAGSVVLAAGGFVMNPDMVSALHARARLEAVHPRLDVRRRARHPARRVGRWRAQAHGRAVHHRAVLPAVGPGEGPDRQQARRAVRRRGQLPRADVVPRDAPARTGRAYLIVDSEHMEEQRMSLCPLIDGWETVEEMEAGLDLPAGSLVATLARYNEHAARGEDPDFHKHPDWLAPQDTGPWGAYDLTLGQGAVRRLHPRRPAGDRRRPGAAPRRLGGRWPVRRRRLRLEHRPGRRRLLLRHPARRGVVLRAPGGAARRGQSPGPGDCPDRMEFSGQAVPRDPGNCPP